MIQLPIYNTDKKYNVNPTKIIALGLNYLSHINESDKIQVRGFTNEIPQEPILFCKTPNVIIGNLENIVLPKIISKYNFEKPRTDFEGELAFIIKRKCKNVSEKEAFDYILGFTVANDVSQRNIQNLDKSGWFRGKSFDTFGPIGPQLVLTDDLKDPHNLKIESRLNGIIYQSSNTSNMIFKIPQILSFVSKNFTLEEGDIIFTGTPAGVGELKPNDIIEIEIENIGILKNFVVEEK